MTYQIVILPEVKQISVLEGWKNGGRIYYAIFYLSFLSFAHFGVVKKNYGGFVKISLCLLRIFWKNFDEFNFLNASNYQKIEDFSIKILLIWSAT